MTNYDKIKSESIEGIASLVATFEFKNVDECKKCFRYNTFERWGEVIKWLHEEIKPTLSETERVILENIDKDYKWIARDKDNSLWLYGDRPIKKCACWSNEYSKIGEEFAFYKHLFQFITWQDDEPYNIEELLNG